MPTETGIYTPEDAAHGHDFSYRLAQWIGQFLPKKNNVIDLGCGPGTYLRYLHDIGFENLLGIEGTPLNFEYEHIWTGDLTDTTTSYTAGHVISLEVGEHIPEHLLPNYLNLIMETTKTGHFAIISWAIPGQDGIGHISCRSNIWVINELQKRKFRLLAEDTLAARSVIEERQSYFRNTLMIFQKQ